MSLRRRDLVSTVRCGSDAVGAAVGPVRVTCRLLLQQLMEFSVRWADGQESVLDALDLAAGTPVVAAYNQALERTMVGDGTARELLSLGVSGSPESSSG